MITHIVQKPFMHGKTMLKSGDPIDTSGWRLVRQLEQQRYIRAATDTDRRRKVAKDGE